MSRIFTTPRPVPGRLLPAVAGSAVILLGLPVFLAAGWPLSGWALALALWAGGQGLQLLLARLDTDTGNLAAASVVGIGTTFRAMAVGIPLVAVTVADTSVGLSAAVLYALAYTLELALLLAVYFNAQPTPLGSRRGGVA